jgi:hypothetical protein
MTSKPLPDSPNIEHLKKQAKALLHAVHARDAEALTRLAALPALSETPIDRIDATDIALHDAQSVIAREHGFASWNALREEVEARTLSFADAVDAFVRAASDGAPDRGRRLLALYPSIATATLQTELLLADAASVEKRLRDRPELATIPGGPQQWEPLLYVCHTSLHRKDPQGMAGLLTIARLLLSLGANPNAEYKWNWHPELPRTALWAALITLGHIPLATALLEAGANPTDGVTPQIAAGSGNIDALELLHRFGLNPNGVPGGVPPLAYMMMWSEDARGPRWLLEHGADPNLPWGPDGEGPLHIAARRWDVPTVELLLQHGADPARRRADGYTAHALAELHGNHAIAELLMAHGAVNELSPLDQFIAATARADGAAADAVLAAHPAVKTQLTATHHLMLHRHAESGNATVLQTMLERGFDPNVADKDGVTALHRAAMGGHPDAAAALIRFGAKLDALDGMFSASPLVWAVEGRGHAQPGSDHVGVARVLIDAGSPLDWVPPPAAPGPERTIDGLRQLRADVRSVAR